MLCAAAQATGLTLHASAPSTPVLADALHFTHERSAFKFCGKTPRCAPGIAHTFWDVLRARVQPGLLAMTSAQLFGLMHGRTWWLFGDSVTNQVADAWACMLRNFTVTSDFVPFQEVSNDLAAVAEMKGIAHHLHKPGCVLFRTDDDGGTARLCKVRQDGIGEAEAGAVLKLFELGIIKASDAVIASSGLHYDIPSGVPPGNALSYDTYQADVRRFAAQVARASMPVFWETVPPQHFDVPRGDFRSLRDRRHIVCSPAMYNTFLDTGDHGWYNAAASGIMVTAGVRIVDTWNASVPFWFGHIGRKGDCTHVCTPGTAELRAILIIKQAAMALAHT